MNVTHEYNGIGFVFKPTKQPICTKEEALAYVEEFLEEVRHAAEKINRTKKAI